MSIMFREGSGFQFPSTVTTFTSSKEPSLAVECTVIEINPVLTLFPINFNITLPSISSSLQWFLPVDFPTTMFRKYFFYCNISVSVLSLEALTVTMLSYLYLMFCTSSDRIGVTVCPLIFNDLTMISFIRLVCIQSRTYVSGRGVGWGALRERRDMLCNPHGELWSLWIDGIDLVNYLLNTVCVVTRVHNLTNKFKLPL